MKKFPPFRWIFIIFGFVQVKYESQVERFKFNAALTGYSFLFSFVLSSYRTYALYSHCAFVAESEYFAASRHIWIGNFVVYADFCTLYLLNTITPYLFFLKRASQLKLLNALLEFQKRFQISKRKNTDTFQLFIKAFIILAVLCPIFTILMFKFSGVDIRMNSWMYLFLMYAVLAQYVFGHLYEFGLFTKIKDIVPKEKCLTKSNIRQFIDIFAEVLSIAEKCEKLFQLNKLFCMPLAMMMMSIYGFYHLDKRYVTLIPLVLWEIMISIIFFTCFAWGAVHKEVSNYRN